MMAYLIWLNSLREGIRKFLCKTLCSHYFSEKIKTMVIQRSDRSSPLRNWLGILSLIIVILSSPGHTRAQDIPFITTNGSQIIGPCGDVLTLRGVNYAPFGWGYAPNSLFIDQIAQSGANAVRLVWYADPSDPNAVVYQDMSALEQAISACIDHDLIVILELHDWTCAPMGAGFQSLADWWTSEAIFSEILWNYRHSIIVNYANEALHANWSGLPANEAADAYRMAYEGVITALRSVNGFGFPIMIDAPDCGTHSDLFTTPGLASGLIEFDPAHNLIFSTHTYWYGYANNDPAVMQQKISNLLGAQIPFVLGEVANLQDDKEVCQYTLNYGPLLEYCQSNEVSWLAWGWMDDLCAERQISSNGMFGSLTPYGEDIVHHTIYGLSTTNTPKSQYLTDASCGAGISSTEVKQKWSVYPNPAGQVLHVKAPISAGNTSYHVADLTGRQVGSGVLFSPMDQIETGHLAPGMYHLILEADGFPSCPFVRAENN
jgi:mannan endo-1,4-beta-mannosidase